jgi:glycosyltransferase involved in cell wall biosynthesis
MISSMPVWLDILLWVLAGLSMGLQGYWGAVTYHVIRTMKTIPTLREALRLPNPASWPSLYVVIPAHNEERGIGELLDSLKKQDYPNLHVVFALDRCTDRTVEIVRAGIGADPRFEIIEISDCPDDWVGKVHAIWSAYSACDRARHADLLLFLDADTRLEPECIRASVTLLLDRKLDMLSLMSTLTGDEWFEKVVQPAACMELLRQYPVVRANSDDRRRAFANGQFILITQKAYESIGGHTAVKSDVLEDVYFARHVAAKGNRLGLFFADGLLVCRMYNSWKAFERGWLRIFGECANRKPGRLVEAAWRLRLIGTMLPVGGIAGLVLGTVATIMYGGWIAPINIALAVIGLAIYGGVMGFTYWFGRTPLAYAPSAIVGSWMASSIMLKAARNLSTGNPTHWGGRVYQRDVR